MKKLKNPQKLHLSLNTVKLLSSIDLQRARGGVHGGESEGCPIETSRPKPIG